MRLVVLLAACVLSALTPAAAQAPAPLRLALPIACEPGKTCEIQSYMDRQPGPGVRDYRCNAQTYENHMGTDIRLMDMAAQRRGVAVLAAAPGRVFRVRDGVPDRVLGQGVLDQNDPQGCGNAVVIDHAGGWRTSYCHMARGSVLVKPGDTVTTGQPLGKVGLSGLTEFPHVHLDVQHDGQRVDPFAPDMSNPGACQRQASLWAPEVAAKLAYRAGVIVGGGFTEAQPSAVDLENGVLRPFTAASPWLIAYVRTLNLLAGDETELELKGPGGVTLARTRNAPLVRPRAIDAPIIGKRQPPTGWARGAYTLDYRVWRQGKVALSRRLEVRL